jgi:membrane-associated phospholipid phosphatase
MYVPIIKLRRAHLIGFVVALPWPVGLKAQQAGAAPVRFEVRAWPELVLLGASGVAALIPELSKSSLPHATCAPCDPRGLWGIDRGAIGSLRARPAAVSNLTLAAAVAASGFLTLRRRAGEGTEARREDLAVYAQSLSATVALTDWLKVATRRPRPVLYSPDSTAYGDPSNGISFPSGHTSAAFAAAAAYASILHRRGLASRHQEEIAALFGLAAATGVLRVWARKHFPTDVAAGTLLGTAVGWLVPAVHASR